MGKIYTPDSLNDILLEMQMKMERLEKYVAECTFSTGDLRTTTGKTLDANIWLLCDGKPYSRTAYPDLNKFLAANGYPYGNGDGSTTFNVPNFSGRTPVGPGAGTGGGVSGVTGTAPNGGSTLTARVPGDWGGAESHTLGVSEMPSHAHGGSTGAPSWNGSAGLGVYSSGGANNFVAITWGGAFIGGDNRKYNDFNHTHSISSEGGGGAHNNVQPFLVCNFYIKT